MLFILNLLSGVFLNIASNKILHINRNNKAWSEEINKEVSN